MSSVKLSSRDKAILTCVFNPHLPLEEVITNVKEELRGKKTFLIKIHVHLVN